MQTADRWQGLSDPRVSSEPGGRRSPKEGGVGGDIDWMTAYYRSCTYDQG